MFAEQMKTPNSTTIWAPRWKRECLGRPRAPLGLALGRPWGQTAFLSLRFKGRRQPNEHLVLGETGGEARNSDVILKGFRIACGLLRAEESGQETKTPKGKGTGNASTPVLRKKCGRVGKRRVEAVEAILQCKWMQNGAQKTNTIWPGDVRRRSWGGLGRSLGVPFGRARAKRRCQSTF